MIKNINPIPIPPFRLLIKSFLRFFEDGKDISHKSNDNIVQKMIISIGIRIYLLNCQPYYRKKNIQALRLKL